jgi:hypothetical protein
MITTDDYAGEVLIKEANAQTGIVVATNKITVTARVTYFSRKKPNAQPWFFCR